MPAATEPLACHCLATRKLARQVSRIYERHLAGANLTSAQFSILASLQRNPGTTMRVLADEMVMDRTTLLRAIKPLQRDGLLVSAPGPRANQLALSVTARGRRRIESAMPLWQAAQAEYEAQVGSSRAARIRTECLALTSQA